MTQRADVTYAAKRAEKPACAPKIRNPPVGKDPRERERVVATDGDEDIDAERLDVFEDDRCEVEPILAGLAGGYPRRVEPRRQGLPGHLRRVGPRPGGGRRPRSGAG